MIEEAERYAEQHSPGIRYRALLVAIRDLLALHEVKIWPERLSAWLRELDDHNEPSRSHVRRTRDALSGPGRLDDIFICKANGHRIASSDGERDVNRRYSDLLRELNDQTSQLLRDFPR